MTSTTSASDEQAILLDALADVVSSMLGAQGTFPPLGVERTEEILLLLLRSGRVVRGHDRVWMIPIAPEDVPAVRAARGHLSIQERIESLTTR